MAIRWLLIAIGVLAGALSGACSEAQVVARCQPAAEARNGWSASFVAGCMDGGGHYAGGSQVMHLVPYKGQLYAAVGYWEDAHNVWYGGSDARTGWSQILRLSAPGAPWVVDLEMGPRHLRPELLTSVTFSRDAAGHTLAEPATLLLAAAYDGNGMGSGGVHLFRRDDASGTWVRSAILQSSTGQRGEDNSVRKALVHRDRVTGREYLFVSVGVAGLFRAEYDPGRPEKLVWSDTLEFVPTGTRILGLTEADGSLFVSDGSHVMRRIDGPTPRYEEIADFTSEIDQATTRKQFSEIGGIRGLTAIPGPVAGRQSLLLMWHPGRRGSRGCVIRLDPVAAGAWQRRQEVCLADLAAQRIGVRVGFVLGAYSDFVPLTDRDGNTTWLAGLDTFVVGPSAEPLIAHNLHKPGGGFYAGALYALRDAQGHWRVDEVSGGFKRGDPERVSIYSAAMSPFVGDTGRVYVGGYDPNDLPSTNTAWVASAGLGTVLGQ